MKLLNAEKKDDLPPLERKEYNVLLVLEWLYLTKFIDYKIAELLLEVHEKNAYRIVKQMAKDGLVQLFMNDDYTKKLIALDKKGYELLKQERIMPSDARKHRFNRLKTYSGIKHALGLQKAVISLKTYFVSDSSIFDDYSFLVQLEPSIGSIRPDATVKVLPNELYTALGYNERYNLCVEYERSKKSRPRTLYQMQQHHKNLSNGEYNAVCYVCENADIANHYRRVFNQDTWDRYSFDKHKRSVKRIPYSDFQKDVNHLEKYLFFYFDDDWCLTS